MAARPFFRDMRYLIFDLDRTLWDFDGNAERVHRALFERCGLKDLLHVDFETYHDRYRSINDMLWEAYRNGTLSREKLSLQRFTLTFAAFGVDVDSTDVVRLACKMDRDYLAECSLQVGLMPGARELLEWLHARRGDYRLAVASNGFVDVQMQKMRNSGLLDFFDYVFLSETMGSMKPDRRFFDEAKRRMGATARECLMIGDDYQVDILGAMSAGIPQVFYNPQGRALPADSAMPSYTVTSLSEIIKIVE